MGVGRPTNYGPHVLEQTREYIDRFKGESYELLLAKEVKDEVIPTMEGLAEHLGRGRQTLYDWKDQEDKKEFSDMLDELLSRQARLLMNMGLSGKFNPQISKLVLAKHGYSEKTENTIANKEGQTFKTESTFNFIPVNNGD